jgi:hypothetical protein
MQPKNRKNKFCMICHKKIEKESYVHLFDYVNKKHVFVCGQNACVNRYYMGIMALMRARKSLFGKMKKAIGGNQNGLLRQ